MKENLRYYFENNLREYFIVCILFLIGIIAGIMVVNNSSDVQKTEITKYMENVVKEIKEENIKDNNLVFLNKIKSNFLFGLICIILGSTIIGVPILLFLILYKGFSLGYTISSIMATMESGKGIIFILSSLVIQNIFYIFGYFVLAVSGINFCKAVFNNEKRYQIKLEIIKFLIFSAVAIFIIIISTFLESYVSFNLIKILKKYF